ncbi:MAG: hypothetical protein O7B26_00725 [Planctomycetota bacterium]|nr:hypothetical protein [Planctomycetota bacterium]
MESWGPSPISVSTGANTPLFARAAYWLGWFNRHCHPVAGCDHARRFPGCDPTTVGPAFRVEIRSIEVAVDESDDTGSTRGSEIVEGRALRQWPFRWPPSEAESVAPEPVDEPVSALGNYLDVLV